MDSPGWKQGGHRRQAEAGQNTEIFLVQWARLGVSSPLCVQLCLPQWNSETTMYPWRIVFLTFTLKSERDEKH